MLLKNSSNKQYKIVWNVSHLIIYLRNSLSLLKVKYLNEINTFSERY
jgi:hypothetical protein